MFNRFLQGNDLDQIQELFLAMAPKWCSKLRVWKSARNQVPIDTSQPGALAAAVLIGAGERGETYEALVGKYGRPPLDRFLGSVELRGAGPELVVVISVDQMVLSPLGPKQQLGNQLTLQVRRPKVEGRPGAEWLRSSFEAFCAALAPAWGAASHPTEYWAKVMSDDPPIRAVGRDFGRFLPGVFWLNFFGRPYKDLLGKERLWSVPCEKKAVDDGVLVVLGIDPRQWDEPGFAVAEQRVRDHLGSELFFSKASPERAGVVPKWLDRS